MSLASGAGGLRRKFTRLSNALKWAIQFYAFQAGPPFWLSLFLTLQPGALGESGTTKSLRTCAFCPRDKLFAPFFFAAIRCRRTSSCNSCPLAGLKLYCSL